MKRTVYIAETAALAAADQILKTYVEHHLEPGREKELKGRLVLRRFRHRPKAVRVLSSAAAAAVAAVQAAVLLKKGHFLQKQGIVFLSAGAWSNTFDRWFRGGVVDYAGVRCKCKKISGITYNLADVFIAAGSAAAAASALLPAKKKRGK